MITYIIYGLVVALTGWLFWNNRKDLGLSMKAGEGGFSARKLIAFQLMIPVFLGDTVYIWKFYIGSPWAEKIFLEWIHTHALYVMFVLGFLSFPEIIKFINTIKGVKEEKKEEGGV